MRTAPAAPWWVIAMYIIVADVVFLRAVGSGIHPMPAILQASIVVVVLVAGDAVIRHLVTRIRFVAARRWVEGMRRPVVSAQPTTVDVSWWVVDVIADMWDTRRTEFPDECLMAAFTTAVHRLQRDLCGDTAPASDMRDRRVVEGASVGVVCRDRHPDPHLAAAWHQPYLAAVREEFTRPTVSIPSPRTATAAARLLGRSR